MGLIGVTEVQKKGVPKTELHLFGVNYLQTKLIGIVDVMETVKQLLTPKDIVLPADRNSYICLPISIQ